MAIRPTFSGISKYATKLELPNPPDARPQAKLVVALIRGPGSGLPLTALENAAVSMDDVPATVKRSPALRQTPDAAGDVTVVLTSCGRQDLLERTLDSFFAYNTYPIQKFIVIEDGDGGKNKHLSQKHEKYSLTWLDTGVRVGQVAAIDIAYSFVKTDFIFHCEDDWEFLRPRFIERSLKVLNADEKVLQVYLRDKDDTNGHPVSDRVYFAEWVPYRLVACDYDAGKWGVWHGFAWNPGLRRRRDYDLLGSFGSLDPAGTKLPWQIEREASVFYRNHGFVAAILAEDCGPGYIRHLGDDRHVPEVQGPAATSSRYATATANYTKPSTSRK